MLILSLPQIAFCSGNEFVHAAFSGQEPQSLTVQIS
jgi:hypothetical protein